MISERKQKAHWVQNIMHNPRVMFTVNFKSFEGTARTVDKHSEHKLAYIPRHRHRIAALR
jgi:F420H(2)-dependent quinone reductase